MHRALLDERLKIRSELVDARHHRCRARVAEHTDRLAGHVVGDAEQRIQVFGRPVAGRVRNADVVVAGGRVVVRGVVARVVALDTGTGQVDFPGSSAGTTFDYEDGTTYNVTELGVTGYKATSYSSDTRPQYR